MIKLVCIDTNILIRFLRADHPQLSPKAKKIFTQGQQGRIRIYLDEVIVAEIVWLLSSFYQLDRLKIATKLQELISQKWIVNPRKRLILKTLQLYAKTSFDYVDCWLWQVNQLIKAKLETFDKKLQKPD